MKAKDLLIICGTSGAALCGCTSNNGNAQFTEADMDLQVAIGDDFYQHTNGGWMAQHPIPADKSRFGTFDLLAEENNDQLKGIIDEITSHDNAKGTPQQKIADLYNLGMDTIARDAEGTKALEPYFALTNNLDSKEKIAESFAKFNLIGLSPFFAFGSETNSENSDECIAVLWQSGIGLPDRDYYTANDETAESIRNGYKVMLNKYAEVLNFDNASERVDKVYALEERLASIMYTRKENRTPKLVNNNTSIDDLATVVPNFDWNTFFNGINVHPQLINVAQLKYFNQVGEVINTTSTDVLADYLKLYIIRRYASMLTTQLEAISFDYYGRTVSGAAEQRPLWKRILGVVNGEMLGQIYVEKYFPASSKQRMVELIENLRIAFGQRIDNLAWMSDTTKTMAKEKLAAITVKVGYPDQWTDYTDMQVDKSLGFITNYLNMVSFEVKRDYEKIGKPVDKLEWHMTPQTVNAYYNPSANEIVFPAGILQPPFFYANGDDAVNYGAIGVVIGHEMTHGFDDQGCQFDKKGNLNNWWTPQDSTKFKEATSRLVKRYSSFVVLQNENDTLMANGENTLGENIADLGGLNIAYQAFVNSQNGVTPAPIDGQTADQRFCYAYSRVWAGNIREKHLYNQVKTDPHSPARLRVNVPLPLVDFFYSAFGIDENCKMYVPKEDRIVIW